MSYRDNAQGAAGRFSEVEYRLRALERLTRAVGKVDDVEAAYDAAVLDGFEGTVVEWIESIAGTASASSGATILSGSGAPS